jgi:hypothetical protein
VPLENMRAAAEYLQCSVPELAAADPEWRRMALTVLRAQAEVADRRKQQGASG